HFLVQRLAGIAWGRRRDRDRRRIRRGEGQQVRRRRVQRFERQLERVQLQQLLGQRVEVEVGFRQRGRLGQQRTQRLDAIGAGRDLQGGGHLVEHADQRLVGGQRLVKEARIDRKSVGEGKSGDRGGGGSSIRKSSRQ